MYNAGIMHGLYACLTEECSFAVFLFSDDLGFLCIYPFVQREATKKMACG